MLNPWLMNVKDVDVTEESDPAIGVVFSLMYTGRASFTLVLL